MPLIEWNDSFNTGNPAVDHEHRELVGLINEMHEALTNSKPSADTVGDFLGEINARVSSHFALEERLMREKDYEDYKDHKADHDRLLDDIRDIMDHYEEGNYDAFQHLLSKHLNDWFGVHFSTRDARLHSVLGH